MSPNLFSCYYIDTLCPMVTWHTNRFRFGPWRNTWFRQELPYSEVFYPLKIRNLSLWDGEWLIHWNPFNDRGSRSQKQNKTEKLDNLLELISDETSEPYSLFLLLPIFRCHTSLIWCIFTSIDKNTKNNNWMISSKSGIITKWDVCVN